MAKQPDRLANALAFASRLSATYGELQTAKPITLLAKACPICRKTAKRLVSDHDHETGYNREAICGLCNSGLGMFKDDPRAMVRAARYVLKHRKLNQELTIGKHEKPSELVLG